MGGLMLSAEAKAAEDTLVHILWINAGLSCDGDSVALTAATQPSIEEIALGALPGLPKVAVHWPLIDFECGPAGGADDFLEWFWKADRGELEPFVLVVEGSIPNEALAGDGYWSGFGNNPLTGQPVTTSEWLDRLAPKALAILPVGTGATYAGLHAMAGDGKGFVLATWLDLRNTGTELWSATSRDGGTTWGANTRVYQSPAGHIANAANRVPRSMPQTPPQ